MFKLDAKPSLNRRQILVGAVGVGASIAVAPKPSVAYSANERIRVGVMGMGRGNGHVDAYTKCANVEVAYVCDVDSNRLASAAKRVAQKQKKAPAAVADFRRMLDDTNLDAISIATPNFWHAPATILACSAGKHVYVEKPGSHSMHESQLMIQAARAKDRRVQMGVQRRSMPHYLEAIQRLHEGEIGKLLYARCWYDSARGGIGKGKPARHPDWLDYELWQGPAARRPYKDNLIHYNWHWHWHWGNGEIGNNGIHALDVARWGMSVDFPKTASYTGGRYHFDDDQETPDTGYATYDFGSCGISWEQSSCIPRRPENHAFVTFYGSEKTMATNDRGYKIFDRSGKELLSRTGRNDQLPHFQNFVDAIRQGTKLNADISDAQKGTQLCHLGNISYREGQVVAVHVDDGQVVNTEQTSGYWQRDYAPNWEPKV